MRTHPLITLDPMRRGGEVGVAAGGGEVVGVTGHSLTLCESPALHVLDHSVC